jgi:D-serine deaminase-like pyridoxal phosphate-dependent protein
MVWTDRIDQPTLVLDAARCQANIARMMQRAQTAGVTLRPHAKTHQSCDIANWLRAAGVTCLTVSSLAMAEYFCDEGGWKDIVIAFTVNPRQIKGILALASRCDRLGVLVESIETVHLLHEHLRKRQEQEQQQPLDQDLDHPVTLDVWIDIDTGYHRTGLDWEAPETKVLALARKIHLAGPRNTRNTTRLAGLLVHPGHTYKTRSIAQVETIHQKTLTCLYRIHDILDSDPDLPDKSHLALSIGDTPTCSMLTDFGRDVHEIRPGCFVFYDVMQANIGACQFTDIAVAVACPVVAKQPALQQIVVYGGAVHLSKDRIVDTLGRTNFGKVATATEDGWQIYGNDAVYVKSLSQEHGLIHADDHLMQSVQIGDILLILPIHSCLAANLHKRYQLLDGTEFSAAHIPKSV